MQDAIAEAMADLLTERDADDVSLDEVAATTGAGVTEHQVREYFTSTAALEQHLLNNGMGKQANVRPDA